MEYVHQSQLFRHAVYTTSFGRGCEKGSYFRKGLIAIHDRDCHAWSVPALQGLIDQPIDAGCKRRRTWSLQYRLILTQDKVEGSNKKYIVAMHLEREGRRCRLQCNRLATSSLLIMMDKKALLPHRAYAAAMTLDKARCMTLVFQEGERSWSDVQKQWWRIVAFGLAQIHRDKREPLPTQNKPNWTTTLDHQSWE